MPHKDANHEPAVGPAATPEPGPTVQPPARPVPPSPRGMAKVLERAIAPDLVPPVVKQGNLQVDTATYIAELADVARHQRSRAAAGAAYSWIKPQET